MLRKMLVTLDGSNLAEMVLPYVESFGGTTKDIVLVRVIAPPTGGQSPKKTGAADYVIDPVSARYIHTAEPRERPPQVGGEYWYQDKEAQAREAAARDYLSTVAERLKAKGFNVETTVLFGNPADEIVAFAKKCKASFIVMCTHGRSGLGRLVYGSVADKVLRTATIPVFLVRAGMTEAG